MKYLNYLIKPASSLCNLRCRYCFYCDIAENRTLQNMGLMKQETVRSLLRQTFSHLGTNGAVHFAFQGGEPTLAGLDFYRDFLAQTALLNTQAATVTYSIQTNGIALDEAWAKFLKEHDFLVGLSMDGYRDMHNLYRVNAQGKETWSQVNSSFRLLEKNRVRVNVLCVVTAQCAKHPEKVYKQLKALGARYLQFIPCIDPLESNSKQPPFSLSAEAYGRFLCRVFDLWFEDWVQQKYCSIRLFEDYINILLGCGARTTCSTCGNCGGYLVVEGDGSVYPCDFFALDRWKMGNIRENTLLELANSPQAREFLQMGAQKPPECSSCRWKTLCNGGCKNDWNSTPVSHNRYCKAFRSFFSHAESRLLTVARAELQARQNSH